MKQGTSIGRTLRKAPGNVSNCGLSVTSEAGVQSVRDITRLGCPSFSSSIHIFQPHQRRGECLSREALEMALMGLAWQSRCQENSVQPESQLTLQPGAGVE